jgi:hypothetical protein
VQVQVLRISSSSWILPHRLGVEDQKGLAVGNLRHRQTRFLSKQPAGAQMFFVNGVA